MNISQLRVIYNNAGFSPGGRKNNLFFALIALYLGAGPLLKRNLPDVFWSVFLSVKFGKN